MTIHRFTNHLKLLSTIYHQFCYKNLYKFSSPSNPSPLNLTWSWPLIHLWEICSNPTELHFRDHPPKAKNFQKENVYESSTDDYLQVWEENGNGQIWKTHHWSIWVWRKVNPVKSCKCMIKFFLYRIVFAKPLSPVVFVDFHWKVMEICIRNNTMKLVQ